jgi:hypothetical protein
VRRGSPTSTSPVMGTSPTSVTSWSSLRTASSEKPSALGIAGERAMDGLSHNESSRLAKSMALLEAEDVSGNAATALVARLADLLGDTEAGHFDVLLALITALRATVTMARGGQTDGSLDRHDDDAHVVV